MRFHNSQYQPPVTSGSRVTDVQISSISKKNVIVKFQNKEKKRKIKKRFINEKVMFNWRRPVFAHWRNLFILLLWNQMSQEADIHDYVSIGPILVYLTEKYFWHNDFFGQIFCCFSWNDPKGLKLKIINPFFF